MKRQVHSSSVDAPATRPRVPWCRKTAPAKAAPALRRPSRTSPRSAGPDHSAAASGTQKAEGTPTFAQGPAANGLSWRILIADAHPMFRAGLAHWISLHDGLTICAEASTAAEALAQVARREADLFITELTLPGRCGLELIRDALALAPRLPLLVLSAYDESLHAERALRAGARGYLMKESPGDEILTAIRSVLAGKVAVSPRMSERLLETISRHRPRGSQSPISSLTDREFEVFQLIGLGQSTRAIANSLHISPKTVEVHRGHLREKLSLKDSTALIHHAVRWAEAEAPPPGLRH